MSTTDSSNALMFSADDEALISMAGVNINDFTNRYEEVVSAEEKIANSAFGLNGRARVSLEYKLLPFISIGVQGSAGYHLILSGEQAANSVKGAAIDQAINDQIDEASLRAQVEPVIKEAAGLSADDEVNLDDLKGVNYSAGAFLNIKF